MCEGGPCACGQSHCWHHYPERGWIQFLILRLLYEKPSYGYQLIDMLDEKSSGLHRLETGSIYTLLRRMEHRGLLKSQWEEAENTGPDRRVYKVTKSGAEALKTGLQAVVRRKALMDDLTEFYKKKFEGKERR
jgi:DNA-binding PadR family transcriptional regulator